MRTPACAKEKAKKFHASQRSMTRSIEQAVANRITSCNRHEWVGDGSEEIERGRERCRAGFMHRMI